jgi:hypothetical protein
MVQFGIRPNPSPIKGWLETALALITAPVQELPPALVLVFTASNLVFIQGMATALLNLGGGLVSARSAPSVLSLPSVPSPSSAASISP